MLIIKIKIARCQSEVALTALASRYFIFFCMYCVSSLWPLLVFVIVFRVKNEVENEWKTQWKGKTFFSHGTNHSRGVLILVKDQLDFKLQSLKVESQGRYVLLEALIQDSPFALLNIYAPNKCAEQCDFFNKISEELKSSLTLAGSSFVIGGYFNVIFDQDLDGSGGIKKTKESVKILEYICLEQDLIDIYGVLEIRRRNALRGDRRPQLFRDVWTIGW